MGAAIILLALSGALALFAEWQYDRSEVFWRGFGESLIFCIGAFAFLGTSDVGRCKDRSCRQP